MSNSASPSAALAAPHSLTVGDGFVAPVGFPHARPTFSWKLPNGVLRQSAYQIVVTVAGEESVWDSGWVQSDRSVRVAFAGARAFQSRERAEWRVRFRDEAGRESAWSETTPFEIGLISPEDWAGTQWIRPAGEPPADAEPVGYLRRRFAAAAGKNVARARLYVTARGLFEVRVNGERAGDPREHFTNGWTSYHNRLDTLTYDVTDALRPGADNALDVRLGMGWYAGRLGWENKPRGRYGDVPELLLRLEITFDDGTTETVTCDGEWEGTWDGPIVTSSLYDGETYDAGRAEPTGWSPVVANPELGTARLTPKPFPPVRECETLAVQSVSSVDPGRIIFDLGQNMVGWAKIRVPVEKNGTVTLCFAEMLNPDGTLYNANYRSAKSIDYYTAAETGVIEWEPTFTFHGFRYVEVSGFADGARPEADWVTGVVLHSGLRQIGEWESSHAKLNRLQSNIVWGQRGNFVDIPTDCPQRDERMGWTGDAQVFCPTAMFNYDCHAFWKSWLGTMRDDQFDDGRVPHVVPNVLGDKAAGSPGWMDAAVIIPWEVYVRTGDASVLANNFSMMEKLVGWYRSQSVDGLLPKIGGFRDWLQPYAKETSGDTPAPLLGAAFYAFCAHLLSESARVLGKTDEATRYAAEFDGIRQSFARHYFDAETRVQNAPETQTAYLLAIAFDLIPDSQKPAAAAHLVRLIGEADGHLRTGFLGTPYLIPVLDRMGYADLAYDLLLRESYPSWFYSINQGATTMWERWNSYSHETGFGDVGMNSFNHYAYGAIGQWMYERVAGLAPDPAQPGYKHFLVRPLVGKILDRARATLDTPYGRAESSWTKTADGKAELTVTIPPNTTATVDIRDGRAARTVAAGTHRFTWEV